MTELEAGWLARQAQSVDDNLEVIGGSFEPGSIVEHCKKVHAELAAVTRERDALIRAVHQISDLAMNPKNALEDCWGVTDLIEKTINRLAAGDLRKP